jgi:hypothetical protein
MTTEQIRKLCGDILMYVEMGSRDMPNSAQANVYAIREITGHIYEKPADVVECSEPLYKIISGLYEVAKYYCSDGVNNYKCALDFASRLYDDVREMRP